MPTLQPFDYDNAAAARAGINAMAERAGLEECDQPGTGLYHMIRCLISFADVHGEDFDALLSEVRADAKL